MFLLCRKLQPTPAYRNLCLDYLFGPVMLYKLFLYRLLFVCINYYGVYKFAYLDLLYNFVYLKLSFFFVIEAFLLQ